MFGTSIFFAAIAIARETLVSSAIAAVCWLTCGAVTFVFDPIGVGQYVGWIFFIVGAVFIYQLIYKVIQWVQEFKNARFEVTPL
jgi:hypothetical protein